MPLFKTSKRTAGGLLGFLDYFQPFFAKLHVDYRQLRLILNYKLILDLRESSIFTQINGGQSKKPAKSVWGSLWYYLLYGGIMALVLMIPTPFTRYSYFFLAYFVILFTSILSSFSSILLDPRDRQIIGVRGVDDRTLNAARLIHIGYYIGIIVLYLAVPGTILLLYTQSMIIALSFVVITLLFTIFTLILALLLYFVILHVFNGEKLKNVINVFQVIFMIMIYLSGQLPNLFDQLNIGFAIQPIWHWWSLLAIPFWFAAPLTVLETGWTTNLGIFIGVASVALLLSLLYYYHVGAHFEQYIQKMAQPSTRRPRIGYWQRLASWLFSRNKLQQTYFNWAWRLNQTERDFHLRVYPLLGMTFFGLLIVLINFGIRNHGLASLQANHWLLLTGYALVYGAPQIVINLQFSSTPNAVDVFKTIPNFKAYQLRVATLSAIYARLIVPQALLELVLLTWALGWQYPLMELNVLLFCYALTIGLGYFYLQPLPFTQKFTANQAGQLGWGYSVIALFASLIGIAINALLFLILGFWGNLIMTLIWLSLVLVINRAQRQTSSPKTII